MTFEVTERLYLTGDDELVPEGDPDARWLYAVPGKRIPLEEAEKYGLVNGEQSDNESGSDSVDSSEEPAVEPAETSDDSAPSEAAVEPRKSKRRRKGG